MSNSYMMCFVMSVYYIYNKLQPISLYFLSLFSDFRFCKSSPLSLCSVSGQF